MAGMTVNFILPPALRKAAGGYKVVYQYANYITKQGNDVMIYYDSRMGDNSLHIPVKVMGWIRKLVTKIEPKWFYLDPEIKKKALWTIDFGHIRKADITICTSIDTMIKTYQAKNKPEKIIHFIQGHENWFLPEEEVFAVYRLPYPKIVISQWLYDIVCEHTKEKLYLVKNGIDLHIFQNKNSDKRSLHSIAMMYKENSCKNSEMGLRIVKRLKKRYQDLEVLFYSVDQKSNEVPEWVKFYRKASEDQVCEILNRASVFLCTSEYEGFGLPGLEAMACGCIFVTTDCKGIREYANDSNALISEIGDACQMEKNIIRVFEDKKLRNTLRVQSEKTARSFNITHKEKAFYQALTAENSCKKVVIEK